MSGNKLEYQLKKMPGAGMETFQHLEDGGWIERVSIGDSHRYRVLVSCSCGGGDSPTSSPALRREYSLRLDDRPVVSVNESVSVGDVDVPNGVKSESAQKPVSTVYLSKCFFPAIVRAAGIQMNPLQTNGAALTQHLNRWRLQGVDMLTIQLMMEEFARHPEWCRGARRPPWRVFVGRRDEIASIVAFRKTKDPSNRRWSGSGKEFWLGRHTPRVNYAT
jgi:hypothetical protein